jgi:hypothetical protein
MELEKRKLLIYFAWRRKRPGRAVEVQCHPRSKPRKALEFDVIYD